jgi:putative transposase
VLCEHTNRIENVVYSNKYHVVWCPKYRRKVLGGKIALRLMQILRRVAKQLQPEIVALEAMPSHVHLLVEADPQFGIRRLVRPLKGVSSHHLRKEFPEPQSELPPLWTNRYCLSTVGGAPLSTIKQYVENLKNV